MYNEKLEALITAALADGVLTDKEKNLLFKKAEAMGIDRDEFELVLEGRLAKRKKEMEAQAPQAAKPAKKEGAIPQELDDLIKEYLTDGIISAKERQVLLNKAQALGLNVDEVDLYIDAQQQKADQAVAAAVNKRRGKTCPYCGSSIPELTDKCPNCGGNITPEASKELEEIFEHLETALVNFKAGEDVEKNKAEVERYARKARMYYGDNPKIQRLLDEVETEAEAAEADARKNYWIKILIKYKFIIIGIIIAIIIAAFFTIRANKAEFDAGKTTELVNEAIQQGDLGKAEALISAYTSHKKQYEGDLGNVRESLNNAYLEAGDFDKVYNTLDIDYIRMCIGDEAQKYYDLTCKCIDILKKKGKSDSEIRSFIDRKCEAYEENAYEKQWNKDRVIKRLYKYAGV